MTREQAVKWLKDLMRDVPMPQYEDALDMAIQALTQEPYKGMTNGQVHDMLYQMLVELKDGADRYGAEKWWNSPYEPQERSENVT